MKLDKFTVKAQEALQESQAVARKRDHQEILPEHVLAALLAQQDGLVAPILQRVGAEPALVQQRLEDELRKVPQVHGGEGGHLAQRTLKVLDAAEAEAAKMKDEYVSTEHILLALASEKRGVAAEVLKASGANRDRIAQAIAAVRGSQRVTSQDPESQYRALAESFAEVRVFQGIGDGLHLLASNTAIELPDARQLAARMPARAAQDLIEWGPRDSAAEQLADTLSHPWGLRPLLAAHPEVPALVDDRPINEYYLLRHLLR